MSKSTHRMSLVFLVLLATTGALLHVAAEHPCLCEDGSLDCLESTEPVRWVCQEPYALKSVSARVMNASTVELLIELPGFALDQKGKIELNFTGQPVSKSDEEQPLEGNPDEELPPANAVWSSRPKIKTPNGLFTKSKINYLWTDLRPGHKYWFKVAVYIEIKNPENMFARPIESAFQTVTMPQLDLDVTSSSPPPPSVTLVPKSIQTATMVAITRLATTVTTTTAPITTSVMTTVPAAPTAAPTVAPVPAAPATTTTTTTTTTTPPPPPPTTTLPTSTITVVSAPTTTTSTTTTTQRPSTISSLSANNTDVNITDVQSSWVPSNLTDSSFVAVGQILAEHIKIERYAWHFLVALSIMTVLFVIVSYLYCKKSRVIAPITSPHYPDHNHHGLLGNNHMPSAYENPTFTKLVSYYANKPHVLLIDETSNHQNYDNMVKQKNLDVDDTSALHKSNSNTHDNKKCSERAIY